MKDTPHLEYLMKTMYDSWRHSISKRAPYGLPWENLNPQAKLIWRNAARSMLQQLQTDGFTVTRIGTAAPHAPVSSIGRRRSDVYGPSPRDT